MWKTAFNFKFFKGCLSQILLDLFLNILTQISFMDFAYNFLCIFVLCTSFSEHFPVSVFIYIDALSIKSFHNKIAYLHLLIWREDYRLLRAFNYKTYITNKVKEIMENHQSANSKSIVHISNKIFPPPMMPNFRGSIPQGLF